MADVVLTFDPDGTQGEYTWICPKCGQKQSEWPEGRDGDELGQVLCENCDEWFDYVKGGL
jgi:hypothetical protein